jgi:DNA-binding IclR family transcriptional regulator
MTPDEAANRIRLEYLEMPDLKLTLPQVRRLCDLPQDACESAVEALLSAGFLQQSGSGRFLLAPNAPGPRNAS